MITMISHFDFLGFFKYTTASYINKLWWQYMPGVTVTLPWPEGQVKVGPSHRYGYRGIGPKYEYIHSNDPNDHYRLWLEQNIGYQGWDWNWRFDYKSDQDKTLTLKVRRKHAKYATLAVLQWS